MEYYKELVKQSFKAVVEDMDYNEAVIERYFDAHYRQRVDGKELDFKGFCQHMKVQKQTLAAVHVDFKTIAQENNIVFTNHLVTIQTREGRSAVIQVIAEFRIQNDKVIYCDELTHLLSGDERERDLGSRY